MRIHKQNANILLLYIYGSSFIVLVSYILNIRNRSLLENIWIILLFLVALKVNDIYINMKFLLFFVTITLLMLLNALFVTYSIDILTIAVSVFMRCLIPIYIFSTQNINFSSILKKWYNFSILFSFLLPFYIYMFMENHIDYFIVGYVAHLNIIIITYFLIFEKYNVKRVLLLIINIAVCLIFGSRMLILSAAVTCFFILIFQNNKGFKFFIEISTVTGLLIYIYSNLLSLLLNLNSFMMERGMVSRNLHLLINSLQDPNSGVHTSGREYIYPIVLRYLSEGVGLPSGLAVVLNLTNREFFHAHNIFLEIFLTFGIILGSLLIALFFIRLVYIYIKRNNNIEAFTFFMMISIPFFIRGIVGTFFPTDPLFLTIFSMALFVKFSTKKTT